jgi:hypothetical protein
MNPMSLSLYPNPATEQITITLPNSPEMTVYLEVYEIGGRSVFRQQYEGAVSQSIEVSGWKKGLYIAKLRTRFTEISEKFVVR